MVGIKEIAKRANVATSTVSNVLNNSRYVSDDIRRKVLEAARELNYTPNLVARSMRSKTSHTIGVLVPEFNIFFTDIINAVEEYMYAQGINIIVGCTSENREKEANYLKTMLQRNIDGLLLLGTGQNDAQLFADYPIPIVTIDRQSDQRISCVMLDNEQGGYIATSHLLRKGYRNIAILTGPLEMQTYFRRRAGYIRALDEYGLSVRQELTICMNQADYQSGWKAMRHLRKNRIDFDAIFAANDFLAVGALKFLLEHGVKIPSEVGVVGFDNTAISELVTPSLTTVNQPRKSMGLEGAKLLLEKIDRRELQPGSIILQPDLIIRDST